MKMKLRFREQGFYQANPGTEIAIQEMTRAEQKPNSRGLRLGNMPQIREVINEELELVWKAKKHRRMH